jgi:6-phosphofructokinase
MAFTLPQGALPDALYWDMADPYHYVRLNPGPGTSDYLIAGGADVILIPEIPFSMNVVADKVRARDVMGSNFSIIVVAEGALEIGHELIYQNKGDGRALRLGGIGNHLQQDLEAATGRETRCVVLGHLQRGGRPNAFDRMLATNFGSCAVRALADGDAHDRNQPGRDLHRPAHGPCTAKGA